jgi:hypothetical protein
MPQRRTPTAPAPSPSASASASSGNGKDSKDDVTLTTSSSSSSSAVAGPGVTGATSSDGKDTASVVALFGGMSDANQATALSALVQALGPAQVAQFLGGVQSGGDVKLEPARPIPAPDAAGQQKQPVGATHSAPAPAPVTSAVSGPTRAQSLLRRLAAAPFEHFDEADDRDRDEKTQAAPITNHVLATMRAQGAGSFAAHVAGLGLSKRSQYEAMFLADTIDLLLDAQVDAALEGLLRRLEGIKLAELTSNWAILDVIGTRAPGHSLLPPSEFSRVLSDSAKLMKARNALRGRQAGFGQQPRRGGGRGRGGYGQGHGHGHGYGYGYGFAQSHAPHHSNSASSSAPNVSYLPQYDRPSFPPRKSQ